MSSRTGVGSQQPFEAAEDQFQAPFAMPSKARNDEAAADGETHVQSSPYFGDEEAAEALEWAASCRIGAEDEEAVDDSSEAYADGREVNIKGRKRRDSQVGSYGDAGSIWDGPVAASVPSSVSSMHHHMNRPELSHRASNKSRRRSRDPASRSPRRERKISTTSARSCASERSASPESLGGQSARPGSVRSSGGLIFGRRRRTDEDIDDGEPRGMLGSILASLTGNREQADDTRSRYSSRPSLGRRRSSAHSVASSQASSRRRANSDAESAAAYDDEEGGGWSDENYGMDDSDEGSSGSLRSNTSDEDGGSDRGGLLPSAFGPLSGAVDPVFGDTRVSVDHVPEDELDVELIDREEDGSGFRRGRSEHVRSDLEAGRAGDSGIVPANAALKAEPSYLDKSCRSRQQFYLSDEDTLIRFTGYRTLMARRIVWMIVSVLTVGIVYLLGRWLPRWRLKWICKETSFDEAEFIMIENQWGDLHKEKVNRVPFARPLSTVFTPSSSEPPSTQAEHQSSPPPPLPPGLKAKSTSKNASARSSIVNGGPTNGFSDAGAGPLSPGRAVGEEQLMDLTFVDYRYTRFALHPPTGRWRMIKDWRDPEWTSQAAISNGISWDQEKDRTAIFGKNLIDIEGKSISQLLVDEVLHPFYMFQIVSIILWSFDDYYYYAFCIGLISAASIVTTLIETKRTIQRMREMSRFTCDVRVLREGAWTILDSSLLVPGDIYDAAESNLTVFPADSVLLSGDAIVNESMLTGESVPVSKVPIVDSSMAALHTAGTDISNDLAKHFLFAGTRIIRMRGNGAQNKEDAGAKAMVVRTGFDTTKGALVRSMLFPRPMGFKFYRDSYRFIGVLAGVACLGFLASSVNFIKLGIAWHTIVVRALDLITVVVPPALPATMSIGTTFAIGRLRRMGIFCISPNRVNIGGKVNVFCFDKTGTLTEEGLDVLGVRTIDMRANRFSELHENIEEVPVASGAKDSDARKLPLLYALATCHSLKVVDGEAIGDPLDVKMFEFTGWTLDEGKQQSVPSASRTGTSKSGKARLTDRPPALVQTVVRPPGGQAFEVEDAMKSGKHAHFLELGVLRTFEFVSSLRRMSVIVKRLKSESMEVFVKGAPEVMADICEKDSFPADYDDLLSYYTRHGYRVIACAGKTMPGMSWIKAQRLRREQAESGLRFLGLIIFENKLKEGTAPAIETLRQAKLVCKMVTGDNPRTAISVARECEMVGQSAHVFMPTFLEGSQKTPRSIIHWSSVDDERIKLDPYTLKPLQVDPHVFDFEELDFQDYQLALTGDVFRWMIDYAPVETLRRMLIKGTIFARMSPDEKHELVERLQALGYTVGFCGDGANDCGALKAADVGISLSEAEASVAAPFTSRSPDISCVIEVIKEGRAALVTSFSCFKYMALYSLIQFTSITILYSFASSLGDFQFLYIDLFIILPVAVAMARTLPYPNIHPKRPTANLVSKKVLISMFGQVIITSAIQVFTFFYVRAQLFYEPPVVDPDQLNVVNPENSALFLVSSFQYILVAAVFSVGPPYRKPIYTNAMLVISLSVLSGLSLYFLFVPSGFFFDILGLVSFPRSFHWALFGLVVVNTFVSFAFERYATAPLTKALKSCQRAWRRSRRGDGRAMRKDGKVYKLVAEDMQHDGEA